MWNRRTKFNNKITKVDGINFHSKAEARRYTQLKLLHKASRVKELTLQPSFILQPNFKDSQGKPQRAINYIADFMYFDSQKNTIVVEDVKGMKTDVYRLKKKLFLYNYPQFEFLET